jgi:hypothetical protein
MHDNDGDRCVALLRRLADHVGPAHHLDPEQAEWLAVLHIAAALVGQDADPDEVSGAEGVTTALGDCDVLQAATGPFGVAGDLSYLRTDDAAAHRLFTALADRAPHVAGAHVALARSSAAGGDLVAMERCLHHALRLDPEHRLAHDDLADLEALRGRFRTARRHLERAGRPPMGLAAVAANLDWGPVRADRNASCPCGSGLRYKRCCFQTDGWPFDIRVRMLPTRLLDWAERPIWFGPRFQFVRRALGVSDIEDDTDRVVEAALAPAMVELHLFEGGGIRQLATEVGPILRADEGEALSRWVECRHDLYEVVEPGRAASIRTGEVVEVDGLDAERFEGDRARMLAVLLPGPSATSSARLLGGEPIPVDDDVAHEIRAILDGDGDQLAVARAAIESILSFQLAIGDVGRQQDPERDERLRWLFGDRVDAARVRDMGDVDDLVTTIFMDGGGFSVAADHIRWAARQVVACEPPAVWATAQKLTAAGHDRQTVLLHLACAWALASRQGPDPVAVRRHHLTMLRSLPFRATADEE